MNETEMKRDKAILKTAAGDGMGTLRIKVVRISDKAVLGSVRYSPNSEASCEAMEDAIASLCGRYNLEIVE